MQDQNKNFIPVETHHLALDEYTYNMLFNISIAIKYLRNEPLKVTDADIVATIEALFQTTSQRGLLKAWFEKLDQQVLDTAERQK